MIHSSTANVAKYLFGELIGDFFYAPVWWYTKGLFGLLIKLRKMAALFERNLGLLFWIGTLTKPMYGSYDIAGRMISFFMRLVVLFWRVFLLSAYLILLAVIFLIWILLPIFIISQIWYQLINLLK